MTMMNSRMMMKVIMLLQQLVLVVVMMKLVMVDGLSSLHQTSHRHSPSSPSSMNGQITTSTTTTSRRGFMNHVIAVTGAVGVVTTTFAYHPQPTLAYPRRDVGAEGERSGITEAFNEQAYKTNNRLEASGFPIDTVEQEQQRLDNAISSFSYDDITGSSSKNKKQNKSKATSSKSDKAK